MYFFLSPLLFGINLTYRDSLRLQPSYQRPALLSSSVKMQSFSNCQMLPNIFTKVTNLILIQLVLKFSPDT
ncbi:hypothetical protein VNO78_20308 [Psophocarpus tetragonolobus]|uniref:Uncharacterized protein n=1 Tax=Psophocarpus tetragonolobus TaxID=3891 RepID=A0AAN9XH14_PSOTE